MPADAKMEGLDFRCKIFCAGAEKSHPQVTFYGTRVPKNVKSAQEIANPRPQNVKKLTVGRGPTLRPRSGGSGGEKRERMNTPVRVFVGRFRRNVHPSLHPARGGVEHVGAPAGRHLGYAAAPAPRSVKCIA